MSTSIALSSQTHRAISLAIDVRCFRYSFLSNLDQPVCCAKGAPIDVRSKLAMSQRGLELHWANETPTFDSKAESGVVEFLNEYTHSFEQDKNYKTCSAFEPRIAGEHGAVDGSSCLIKHFAYQFQYNPNAWLLDGCTIFPLDIVEDILVPSPRIPNNLLVEVSASTTSLYENARLSIMQRYGIEIVHELDAIKNSIESRQSLHLHLKTLR